MADEAAHSEPAPETKPAKKSKAHLVKGVIMQDGVFSSLGVHNKGDKVELPEVDVVALEKNQFITRV
ncbi:MAG: hypothetical protein IT537_25315 [Hyphomicrobiales bacterium]|nr:hypothetical protein [Hyphomicrobiales bacterium]